MFLQTCAPRFVTESFSKDHYTRGKCFQIPNSVRVNEPAKSFSPMSSSSMYLLINKYWLENKINKFAFRVNFFS